jgi:ABC-type sugar transport system substrate-binding protein
VTANATLHCVLMLMLLALALVALASAAPVASTAAAAAAGNDEWVGLRVRRNLDTEFVVMLSNNHFTKTGWGQA